MFIKRAIISSVFSIALICSAKAVENPEPLKVPASLVLAKAKSPQQLPLQAVELVGLPKQSAFLPLATDLYRPLPICKTFSLSPCCSIESLMHAEILNYDSSAKKIFVKNGGGMTADKIMLSDKYVARLSYKKDCFVEAVSLYNLVQKLNLTSSSIDQIGFNFCLPLSILFVNQKQPKSDKPASVVLMPKASGKALYEYISEGCSTKVLGKMFKELGKSLGKFQTYFMEKIGRSYYSAAHGDFHEENIFCSLNEGRLKKETLWSFNLIDCGSTELKRMHLLMDPLYFLVRTTHYLTKCHFKEKHLVHLAYKFYKGYLENLNQPVVEYLKVLLPSGRSIAQHEEERMNSILFMEPNSKEGQEFLTKFDSINSEAFKPALAKVLPKPDRRRLYAF